MPDPTNEIDALLRWMACDFGDDDKWLLAVRALVAELDALREENNALRSRCKAHQDEVLDRVFEMDALRKRVAELEAHPPASGPRDCQDTMVRWMDQVTAMLCHSMTHSHDAKQELVTRCDAAIDAMRKGEA